MTRPRLQHGAALLTGLTLAAGGCGAARGSADGSPNPAIDSTAPADRTRVAVPPREPLLPPQFARLAGLMPLRSTGVDAFLADYPTFDGRGVLIGIMDSGIDAGVPGLQQTSTGTPKMADLRDFSDEGYVPLKEIVPPHGGVVEVDGIQLTGFGRLLGLARPPFYGGTFGERGLGPPPAGDLNGDGDSDDRFALIVARASDGWMAITDTDGDGSLVDERPVRDFAVARGTFAYGPMTIAVNLTERAGIPELRLFFDNSGHGTHVAGIAAGHDLFGLSGFDGVAPGAQLLGLKISNNARGGISVTGSMLRAMEYAVEFAERRGMPLVLNLSFGIGNAMEGSATIDSIIDAFAIHHPDVPFVISAGNDGPGISTVDFPGSAEFAITACALFPGVFARPPEPGVRPADDVLGWWSGRGGEVPKPDLCAPGVAFSNVPPWNAGSEVSGGTSMAAPQISGAAALLMSGLAQLGQHGRAVDLRRALVATASSIDGATIIDAGTGVPNVPAAFRWLRAAHQAGRFTIRALADGGNTSRAVSAFRPDGLESEGDTVQRFRITAVGGQPFARVRLRSDAPWLRAPAFVDFHGEPVTVTVTYDAAALRQPGLHVGTVWAIPESDSLAGATFGLGNTITVPEPRESTFTRRRYLAPGRTDRFYFSMTADDAGLTVALDVEDPEREATVYLFEPGGRPHRGTGSLNVGGDNPAQDTLVLHGHDVTAGVYEVVVVAPPLAGVTYRLAVTRPDIAIGSRATDGIALHNRGRIAAEVKLDGRLTGIVSTRSVSGHGAAPGYLETDVPSWAEWLVLDVRIDEAVWARLTDYGVTAFDTAGRLLLQGPLNYPTSRQHVALDSLRAGHLALEFLPAFALPSEARAWTAEVTLAFLAREAAAVTLGPPGGRIPIEPGARIMVEAGVPTPWSPIPEGFLPLMDVTAWTEHGATTSRVVIDRGTGDAQ